MQNKKSILVIRIISIVAVTIAFLGLPGLIRVIWLELTYSYQSDLSTEVYWWNLLWYMWIALLFVLQIVSAYGLFRILPWARKFAIAVFSADFLSRLYGIMYLYFQQPGPPPIPEEGNGVVIESFSLWPAYIITFISLISIIILLQKPIRKVFSKVSGSNSPDRFA